MKKLLLLTLATAFTTFADPVKIILDTDMGSDIDDALALAILHGLVSRNEAEILAITCSKDDPQSAVFINAVNTWYGRSNIPIGQVTNGVNFGDNNYIPPTLTAKDSDKNLLFPRTISPETKLPEAVTLIRKTLASQPDCSVVLIVIGQQTNIARLLESKPDDSSPLTGRELIEKKIKMLSVMAGSFITASQGPVPENNTPEWNVRLDIQSARKVMMNWPTKMVITPFSEGKRILFPASVIENDFLSNPPHPVPYAYSFFRKMPYNRPCWDLISVLYPIRPDRNYFIESPPGDVIIDKNGRTKFKKSSTGNAVILSATPEQRTRVLEAFTFLATERPYHFNRKESITSN